MRRALVRILVCLLVLASGLAVLLLGTLFYGQVSGKEFAPDTFELRTFSYYELPVLRIQITPVRRVVNVLKLTQTLVEKKYIPLNTPPKRWDLVVSRRVDQDLRHGDAQILSRYLEAQYVKAPDVEAPDVEAPDVEAPDVEAWGGPGEPYWLHWTEEHPALAGILWPEVAKLAQQELYLFTPELFALAAQQTDKEAFQGDLKRVLARKYEELAQLEVELENFAAAVRFFTEALSYEPNRETSLRGCARAREPGGRSAVEQQAAPPLSAEADEGPAG